MNKSVTVPWAPFSEKHKHYIKKALECDMSVAEGAIRSGKTIDNCIIAAAFLETCPDRIHLASGSTIGNAKLNIGVCNGFGLENLFRGRCKWGKFKDNEALFLKTQNGEKIVVFAGGGKADSYKRILGNSYGLWIATEINEHFDDSDSRISFIKVAFGRQVAAKKQMVLWDLNPCNPNHSIYKEYIDKYLTEFIGGYNYQHFTIDDNLSISDERKERTKSRYDPSSIWYKRDILGQRCVADGLIYSMFDNTRIVDHEPDADEYYISIDYGTMNPCSMGLWAVEHGKQKVTRVREYYYSGRSEQAQKTDEEYYTELEKLAGDLTISSVVVDPSAASFIATIRKHGRFIVRKADNSVLDGIRLTGTLIKRGILEVHRQCKDCINEFQTYVWDEKSNEDKPIKDNDHAMDDTRYFCQTIVRKWRW